MIVAIQYRKRHALGARQWRPQTWASVTDVEQSLYDHGFDIAAVAEDLDALRSCPRTPQIGAVAFRALSQALQISADLRAWHVRLIQTVPPPLDRDEGQQASVGDALPVYPSISEDETTIRFDELRHGLLMLDYWGLSIAIATLISTLRARLQSCAPAPTASPGQQRRSASPLPGPCASGFGMEHQLDLSAQIAHAAELTARPASGMHAVQRSIFGLRLALLPARTHPGARAHLLRERCGRLMDGISETMHVRHAREVRRVSGGWRDTQEEDAAGEGCYI